MLYLQSLLSDHCAEDVMKSLCEVANEEAAWIRKLTANLDPQLEAAKLK